MQGDSVTVARGPVAAMVPIKELGSNGGSFMVPMISSLGNNTIFWNLTTSLAMLSGRFIPIAGCLIIVGFMKQKKFIPASAGTLQTNSATFGIFLLAIIFILSVLSLFVIFMTGSVAENFSLKG